MTIVDLKNPKPWQIARAKALGDYHKQKREADIEAYLTRNRKGKTKPCKTCGQDKSIREYRPKARICNDCYNAKRREKRKFKVVICRLCNNQCLPKKRFCGTKECVETNRKRYNRAYRSAKPHHRKQDYYVRMAQYLGKDTA